MNFDEDNSIYEKKMWVRYQINRQQNVLYLENCVVLD